MKIVQEQISKIILAIQTLPDALAVGATDSPLHQNLYVGSSTDLKALIADYVEKLNEINKNHSSS